MIGRQLGNVPKEHNFRLKDGYEIKNLYELSINLAGMNDETFMHHVNGEKNDFMNWVLHVLKDEKLAKRLAKTKDRGKTARIVEKRITELEKEKRHHEQVVEQGIKWGVKQFGIGLVTGLFIGLVFLRALGKI